MSEIICYRSGMSNGYFIKGTDGAIAVDTGAEMGTEPVKRHLEEAGLRPEDIRLIVITHGHVDHFMNVQAFADVTGAPVICHEKARMFIEEGLLPDVDFEGRTKMGKEMWAAQQKKGNPVDHAPKGPVNLTFGDEGFDLKPYGIDGTIVYTPGHSRSCSSVVIGEEAIVGDLFTAPAFTDLVGMTYFQYQGAPYEQPQESVEKLLDMGVRKFWPGHGNPRDDQYVRKALEEEKAGHEMYYSAQELKDAEVRSA